MSHAQSAVKVVCRGSASTGRHKRVVALYEWDEQDSVWIRVDMRASDDMFVSMGLDGLQVEGRPLFKCSCGRTSPRYTHDELQPLLQQAADAGKPLTV